MKRPLLQALALLLAFALGALLFRAPSEHAHDSATEVETTWTCSMHPSVRSPEPGLCPICGMELIPLRDDAEGEASTARVVLSERARALAKLRTTAVVRSGDAEGQLRLLGRVEADEGRLREVTSWVPGRIDRLLIRETGTTVRPGQAIATLYSPELYAAHQDLLAARAQVERLPDGAPARAALEAARERLRLWGVPEADLATMEQATEPSRALTIRSPYGGTVLERVATEGAYVETGAVLYRLGDLRSLWVQLDAYERDLASLAVGQHVSLEIDGRAGAIEGEVAFIEPRVDPARRTAKVRVEVENDGQLLPGMYAEAVVATGAGGEAPLVIPASAPLFTGSRSLVYVEVETEAGLAYEPRTVRLGSRLGSGDEALYPVLDGLAEGERVVSRGAFALDADLQIRGGPSMMAGQEGPPLEVQDPQARAAWASALEAYLGVQRALALDDHTAARAAAVRLEAQAPGDVLRSEAGTVARSASIEEARRAFEPLSQEIEALLARFGNPLAADVHVATCPMVDGNRGARWVQQGTVVDNAYFGAAMLRCGEILQTVPPAAP